MLLYPVFPLCDVVAVLLLINDSLLLAKGVLALGKGHLRLPLCALAGGPALVVHLVDLLEGVALGLVNVEVDKGDADKAEGEPDEEDLGLQVGVAFTIVDQVGGCVGNGPVQKPLSHC
jgi:hypothetical protein